MVRRLERAKAAQSVLDIKVHVGRNMVEHVLLLNIETNGVLPF